MEAQPAVMEMLREDEKYVVQATEIGFSGAPKSLVLEKVHTRNRNLVGRDRLDIPMTSAIVSVKDISEKTVIQVEGTAGILFYELIKSAETKEKARTQFDKQKKLGDQFSGIDFEQILLVQTLRPETRDNLANLTKVPVRG